MEGAGESSQAPFLFDFPSTIHDEGTHTITAVIELKDGLVLPPISVSFTVDNQTTSQATSTSTTVATTGSTTATSTPVSSTTPTTARPSTTLTDPGVDAGVSADLLAPVGG